MKISVKYRLPRIVIVTIAIVLLVAQWLFGALPVWFFAAPMNLLIGALWLAILWEGFRHKAKYTTIQYLLSAEATYIALALAALLSVVLGLQGKPATTSWCAVGGFLFVQTVLTLVILRGWRNETGVRWRFLIIHCGLWLAVTSALLGAPDKVVMRAEVSSEPTRIAIDESGKNCYLDYELRLEKFEVENSESGVPQMFRATVAVGDRVVEIEVNNPYSWRYGEDIYLVSYDTNGCILQIVREPWRGVTVVGVAMLLLGALMLFLQGFGGVKR